MCYPTEKKFIFLILFGLILFQFSINGTISTDFSKNNLKQKISLFKGFKSLNNYIHIYVHIYFSLWDLDSHG